MPDSCKGLSLRSFTTTKGQTLYISAILRAGAMVMYISTMTLAQQAEQDSSLRDEVEHLKAVVEGLQESSTEYQGIVEQLRKIKISGYMQTQFRWTDVNGTLSPFSGGNFPTNSNKVFQVRRGRIKINYDNVLTQFVLQFDAVPTGLSIKDAFLSITDPWMQSFGLQMGVFDRPFGYEISFSSNMRESPERSRMFQTLFPGERDLGAKLYFAPQLGDLTWLRADVGIFNGTGANANEFDSFKDVIGRVGAQFPFEDIGAEIDIGVSGYFGNVRNNTKYLWTSGEVFPGVKGFVVDSSLSNLGDGMSRRYVGVDAQFYYDVPYIGGLALRAEYITGKQPGGSELIAPTSSSGRSQTTVSPASQPTGPLYLRTFAGWYVNLVQNIGNSHQVMAKYDVYDPNVDVGKGELFESSNLSPADLKYSTLGFGYTYHWDGNIKFILYYEIVENERVTPVSGSSATLSPYFKDVRDNVLTFRIQYRFPF